MSYVYETSHPDVTREEIDAAREAILAAAKNMPAEDAAILQRANHSPFDMMRGSIRTLINHFEMREGFRSFHAANRAKAMAWDEIVTTMHMQPYWRGPDLAELVERTYDLR